MAGPEENRTAAARQPREYRSGRTLFILRQKARAQKVPLDLGQVRPLVPSNSRLFGTFHVGVSTPKRTAIERERGRGGDAPLTSEFSGYFREYARERERGGEERVSRDRNDLGRPATTKTPEDVRSTTLLCSKRARAHNDDANFFFFFFNFFFYLVRTLSFSFVFVLDHLMKLGEPSRLIL